MAGTSNGVASAIPPTIRTAIVDSSYSRSTLSSDQSRASIASVEELLLQSIFIVKGRPVIAKITTDGVKWSYGSATFSSDEKKGMFGKGPIANVKHRIRKKKRHSIIILNEKNEAAGTFLRFDHILGVERGLQSIDITCVVKEEDATHPWKPKTFKLHSKDNDLLTEWQVELSKLMNQIIVRDQRPQKLLAIINPYGGKKQAPAIFTKKVVPVLRMANVSFDVVQTEYAGHCHKLAKAPKMEQYDGAILVGGDGLFNEFFNGLFARKAEDPGFDPASIPMGLIAAGSTNTMVWSSTGMDSPTMSAIQIVLGERHNLDLGKVTSVNTGKVLCHAATLMGYGFFGDVLKGSEEYRWMGPVRYGFSGFKRFLFGVKPYHARLKLKDPQSMTIKQKQCKYVCSVCNEPDAQLLRPGQSTSKEKLVERVIEDDFLCINAVNVSCMCQAAPTGMSPWAHLNDGYIDLILVKNAYRMQYLNHLVRLAGKFDHMDMSFVDVYKVKEFTVHMPEDSEKSVWNCDGEIIHEPDVKIECIHSAVTIFARGPEFFFSKQQQNAHHSLGPDDIHSQIVPSPGRPSDEQERRYSAAV
eukprot:Clim_evm26s152 gene=Clim_evmTU26s152